MPAAEGVTHGEAEAVLAVGEARGASCSAVVDPGQGLDLLLNLHVPCLFGMQTSSSHAFLYAACPAAPLLMARQSGKRTVAALPAGRYILRSQAGGLSFNCSPAQQECDRLWAGSGASVDCGGLATGAFGTAPHSSTSSIAPFPALYSSSPVFVVCLQLPSSCSPAAASVLTYFLTLPLPTLSTTT